ncbi:hypothetical protein CSOJ01_04478 [Colletotrichum sojae]|uniref:Uncharacterized protein n=1 Tax=Colletotrichum sojae TaxID=2175907 RepID=A0A8H6MYJ1_9PEZI|nr:hypothetical protein CSOJ01_04478 [Colletotrichum sojae]
MLVSRRLNDTSPYPSAAAASQHWPCRGSHLEDRLTGCSPRLGIYADYPNRPPFVPSAQAWPGALVLVTLFTRPCPQLRPASPVAAHLPDAYPWTVRSTSNTVDAFRKIWLVLRVLATLRYIVEYYYHTVQVTAGSPDGGDLLILQQYFGADNTSIQPLILRSAVLVREPLANSSGWHLSSGPYYPGQEIAANVLHSEFQAVDDVSAPECLNEQKLRHRRDAADGR